MKLALLLISFPSFPGVVHYSVISKHSELEPGGALVMYAVVSEEIV